MALLQVNNLYMGFSGETLFKKILVSQLMKKIR